MKKLIAFSVIFALLAGAVFALDLGTFSAQTDIRVDLFDSGPNFDGTHAGGWEGNTTPSGGNGNPHEARVRFSFSYETSGGEAGISGQIRFGQDGAGNRGNGLDGLGTGWWKPVDIVKLSLGGTTFSRRLNEHHIWWDYENDGDWRQGYAGAGRKALASSNFIAFEVGPVADMITLKFGIMGPGSANTEIGDAYINTLVAQAVVNLGDMGEIGFTFDNGTKLIVADYQASFFDVNVKAAFGYDTDREEFGFGIEAATTIEGIGLVARFNTTKFEQMQLFVEASYNITLVELDFGTVTFGPSVSVALNIKNTAYNNYGPDDIQLRWSAPINLTKVIDGFTFGTGLRFSGHTNFNNFDNAISLRIPFTFAYRF